jgi:hypothetical protein
MKGSLDKAIDALNNVARKMPQPMVRRDTRPPRREFKVVKKGFSLESALDEKSLQALKSCSGK